MTDPKDGATEAPRSGGAGGFRPERFRFVLVEPSYGGNVGSAARALRNLGFSRLEIVAPRCEIVGEEARKMAMEAVGLLRSARVYTSLDDALDGAVAVVGTTRRRGKLRLPHHSLEALTPEILRLAAAGEVALLFGREAHGLYDAELDRATHVAQILSEPGAPSFNLAQAVLLAAYELRRQAEGVGPAAAPAGEPPAEHAFREAMFRHLEAALRASEFLQEQTAEGMMRRIRRMLGRAELTRSEVKILRGIASKILWLCGRTGLPMPDEETLRRVEAGALAATAGGGRDPEHEGGGT